MTKAYRYGPWIGALTISGVILALLLTASGNDPISTGLVIMGRWFFGGLSVLLAVGYAFEFRLARKASRGDR